MTAKLLLQELEHASTAEGSLRRIRGWLLELAVRGRLTERLPGDEPASAVLAGLASSRTAAPRGRRARVYEPVSMQEQPFELPRTWAWTRIRAIAQDRGQTTPWNDFTYIDVSAIDKEAGRVKSPTVLTPENAPSRARRIVSVGDVLYSCVRPNLLNVAVIEDDLSPTPIASTAFAVLDGGGLLVPRYLWAVLRSPYFSAGVELKVRGQAYPAINEGDFALLPIPLPPLEEQHRIVAKLDEFMVLIDELEAAQADRETRRDRLRVVSLRNLNAAHDRRRFATFVLQNSRRMATKPEHVVGLRQAILELAVRGRLRTQVHHDGTATESASRHGGTSGPQANSWTSLSLGQACEKITDGTHHTPTYVSSGIPFISVKDFSAGELSFESTRFITPKEHQALIQRCDPRRGDVLIGRIGTLGKAVIVDTDREFSLFVSVGLLRPDDRKVTSEYLRLYLNSPVAQTEYDRIKVGAGTHTNKLNLGDLKALPLTLPPLAEQNRIVAKVNELMTICDELQESLAAEQVKRSRLLDALLRDALEDPVSAGRSVLGSV